MSILSAAEQPQMPQWLVLTLLVWTLVSLAIGVLGRLFAAGVFRGERRLAADESPANFAMILLAGICVWIMIPALYSAATRGGAAAGTATMPSATTPVLRDPAELISLSAIASCAALVVLLAGNFLLRREGLTRLGVRVRGILPAVPLGLAGILFIMPLVTWVGALTIKLWERLGLTHEPKHEMLKILQDTDDRALARLLIFTAAVIAPLYEEVLFRGHLQTLLVSVFGRFHDKPPVAQAAGGELPPVTPPTPYEPPPLLPYLTPEGAVPRMPSTSARWMAIFLTSLAFAVVHPWWTMPPIFFLSLCLGYTYERWGNLWVPIFIHAMFNAISMTVSQYVPQ